MDKMGAMFTSAYVELEMGQILSKKLRNIFELCKWSSSLYRKTLLIFDNWFYAERGDLQEIVTELTEHSVYSRLKILITSREQTIYGREHELFLVHELTDACQLLKNITKQSVTDQTCNEITDIAGGVPLALHAMGFLLNMAYSGRPEKFVSELKGNLIGTLSSKQLPPKLRVIDSIYRSYQYLEHNVQELGRFLSYFPGSFSENDSITSKRLVLLVKVFRY